MKQKESKTKTSSTGRAKAKKPEMVENLLKVKKRTNKMMSDCNISKKDFRENPTVEKFYKTVYEYKLREDAYKTAIEIQLNHLLKESTKN